MRIFKVSFNWDQIIEKVYEYIISNCETFFDVQNIDVTFKIIPNCDEKSLFVAIYHDDIEFDFQNIINKQSLEFTDAGYKKIIINSFCSIFKFSNSKKWLPDNEIRYLKYRYNEIIQLCFMIILKIRKLKKYNVGIIYEHNIINYYFSKGSFDLSDLVKLDRKKRVVDISNEILNKFL